MPMERRNVYLAVLDPDLARNITFVLKHQIELYFYVYLPNSPPFPTLPHLNPMKSVSICSFDKGNDIFFSSYLTLFVYPVSSLTLFVIRAEITKDRSSDC